MPGIGLAVNYDVRSGKRLADLGSALNNLAAIGFSHAELSAKGLGVIFAGRLHPVRLAMLRESLADCRIRVTVHGSAVSSARIGNLVDVSTPAQRDAVVADLELAGAIGAEVLVYHSGMLRYFYGDDRALAAGMAAERDALRALGDEAGRLGVRLAVENIDPVGIYVARRGYGLRLDVLAEQVQAINHPQVGVCLDVGHAFLASRYLDWDYLAAIKEIASMVCHVHLNDNYGQTELDGDADINEKLALGNGDLHLPPGWGAIPLRDVFAVDFPQQPTVILELRPHFEEHLAEALATTRDLLGSSRVG